MPDGPAARPAADGVRPVRLPGLRHGPRHGAAARQEPRSDRPARRDHGATDADLHLRPPRGHRDPGHAGLAAGRHRRARGLRGRAGAAGRRGVGLRALAAVQARECRRAEWPARAAGQHVEGRVQEDGRDLQGVHPRRRRLPDRALAALLAALHAAAIVALPLAAPHQPLAVPDLLRLRRFLDRGFEPRDPGAAARRCRHHPAAGRDHPAWRHAGGGQASSPTRCWPIPRSTPSI